MLDIRKEFKKVQLRNYTLSWPNIEMEIRNEDGKTDVEMSTFRKIIEAGLGKSLKLIIE
jgi:hypothetical protein